MKKITVTIRTLSDVVLSKYANSSVMTESLNMMSGSVVRGILANHWLSVGNNDDTDFFSLFFQNLRFVDALPQNKVTEQRSFVLPLSLQKAKAGGEEKVQDLLFDAKPRLNYKSFRGLASMKNERLYPTEINKNLRLHISRNGSDERLLGSSREGNVYNYESVEKGQTFIGEIIGDEKYLQQLVDGLSTNKFSARIGHSRHTQYGQCEVQLDKITDVTVPTEEDIATDNKIYLRAETSYIPPLGIYTTAQEKLVAIVEILNGEQEEAFYIEDIYASTKEIDNFVDIWNMKRPREYALAAGTVFAVRKQSAWTNEDLEKLATIMYTGCGRRTGEGFGQFRLWHPQEFMVADTDTKDNDVDTDIKDNIDNNNLPEILPQVAVLVQNVMQNRALTQIKSCAVEDAAKLNNVKGKTHFFAELDNMLLAVKDESDVKAAFNEHLTNAPQNKHGTPFNDNMSKIALDGKKLGDLLTEDTPYLTPERKAEMHDASIGELAQRIFPQGFTEFTTKGNKYYFNYWHCFFRAARKKAATK